MGECFGFAWQNDMNNSYARLLYLERWLAKRCSRSGLLAEHGNKTAGGKQAKSSRRAYSGGPDVHV